ncbi:hypothetical protein ACFYNO_07390 [Kitasatospora sp. NPDC006697]|uniref:hypothetical protein n=1 Tax=Kitasatospora sp. NPDC006697 TaxID=3364020 RepID=UPI0036A93AE8
MYVLWSLVGVLIAAGVGVGVWRPWRDTVTLPPSACWGMLEKADYQPLAGSSGTATEEVDAEFHGGPYRFGIPQTQCNLLWNGKGREILDVMIQQQSADPEKSDIPEFGGGKPHRWDFGADAIGWTGDSKVPVVELFLRCQYATAADAPPIQPYVQLRVMASEGVASAALPEVRQALADVSLKLAKTLAQRIPCSNSVQLADRAPVIS